MEAVVFDLFGKKFEPNESLLAYNAIRVMYFRFADDVLAKIDTQYNALKNIEQVINETETMYSQIIETISTGSIEKLNQYGIFDYNAKGFWKYHRTNHPDLVSFPRIHATLTSEYEKIIETEAEKDAYRTARRQNRGRVVGGGFGMEGFIKGAVTAGALNAGAGILHGTFNLMGKAASSIGAAMKMRAMFDDPDLRSSLLISIQTDCKHFHISLIDILRKNGININPVYEKDARKAQFMFSQIDESANLDETISKMIEIISIDPYENRYYEYMIKKYGDRNNEIEKISNFFGVDLKGYKLSVAKKYFESLSKSTLQEANDSKGLLIEYCKGLGGVPEEVVNAMDAVIYECKIASSTELFNSLPKTTEAEALDAREKLISHCKEIELDLNNPIIDKINTIWLQIDKDIRTVSGIEFQTREEASAAKDAKNVIESTIINHELIFRKDHSNLIDEIKTLDVNTELKKTYLLRLEKNLRKFDKRCKKAAKYEYHKKHRNPIFNGDLKDTLIQGSFLMVFMLMCLSDDSDTIICGITFATIFILYIILFKRKKEKRIWEEVTQKGKYDLTDIIH